MKVIVIVCLLVGILRAHVADAKEPMEITGAKNLVAAQIAAISAGDATAFAKTFDGRGYVIFPDIDEADGGTAIAAHAKTWLTAIGATHVAAAHPLYGSINYYGVIGSAWVTADFVAADVQ